MLKNIYHYSPVFIQNIFITLENIFVFYKKFNYIPIVNPMRKISEEVKHLETNYSNEELLGKINGFIEYAILNTQYYSSPHYKKLSSLSDIAQLPFLKKIYLRQNVKDIYSKQINRSNARTLFTSGSTGSPLQIKIAVKDLQFRYRLILKTMLEFGYEYDKPIGRITGHDICDKDNIYRKDYLNNQYFLSAFHISAENIRKYYDVITSNGIKALDGYPSAIYTIVKLFEQFDLNVTSVDTVYTTAEKLHDYQKEKIETFFDCKVYDYYGSNEQSILIYTCKNGRLHVCNKTGYLEVLDEDNAQTPKGEAGRIIVTSLTSHFMPLIRYEIGDSCIVSKNQNCTCGSNGVIIDEIIGRDEDIFKTADGVYITRFSVVLKYLPEEIIESQLVLSNTKMSAVLNYTAVKEISTSRFKEYETTLLSKIGDAYVLEYVHVDQIPKSSKGKARAVVIEN